MEKYTTPQQAQEDWRHSANCNLTIADSFFEPDMSVEQERVLLKICEACEVSQECLSEALQQDEQYGVQGGKTAVEREALQRRGRRRTIASGGGVALRAVSRG